MIGKRLSQARASAGLSLRALADKIDNLVSAQAISKYERDEMMPGSRILIAMARALGVTEEYLVSQSDLRLEGVEFRKKAITSQKEEASVAATVLGEIERYLEVEDLVGAQSASWTPPSEAPFMVRDFADAEYAATSLRSSWNLGTEPIPNLTEFLEERGVKVLRLSFSDNVAGVMCKARRGNGAAVPVVIINQNVNGERQRFTLAHELGHLVLSVAHDVDEEKASHRFASAFLMPREVLWAEVGRSRTSISIRELFQIKQMFGVSVQAIAYRCKDLGIFSETLHRNLFKYFNDQGWRRPPFPEPNPIPPESPKRFERLCYRALSEGLVSEAKAAELLGISARELFGRMDKPEEITESALA